MLEAKLEPGWLRRDTSRAAEGAEFRDAVEELRLREIQYAAAETKLIAARQRYAQASRAYWRDFSK